jgi:hypothetical protein
VTGGGGGEPLLLERLSRQWGQGVGKDF